MTSDAVYQCCKYQRCNYCLYQPQKDIAQELEVFGNLREIKTKLPTNNNTYQDPNCKRPASQGKKHQQDHIENAKQGKKSRNYKNEFKRGKSEKQNCNTGY